MNVFLYTLTSVRDLRPEYWCFGQFVIPEIVDDYDNLDPVDQEAVVDMPEDLYWRWDACLDQLHEIQRRMIMYKKSQR